MIVFINIFHCVPVIPSTKTENSYFVSHIRTSLCSLFVVVLAIGGPSSCLLDYHEN